MGYDITFVATGDPTTDTFPDIQTGGSGPIWRLAKHFANKGHNVTIYGGTYDGRTERIEKGITIIEVPTPPVSDLADELFTSIPFASRIFKLDSVSGSPGTAIERLFSRLLFSYRVKSHLETTSPDVIFFRDRFSAFFPLDLNYPTVYTVKSPDACDFFFRRAVDRHPANHLLFRYKRFIEERNIRKANKAVVMNPRMKSYFISKGLKNTDIIPNGINGNYLTNQVSNDTKRILFVGRLDANKRPEWLIQGYEKSDLEGYEIHFIGAGQREGYLQRQVQRKTLEDSVVFHGRLPRDEVLIHMRQATALVLPSEFEVFGNVLIEAMASGCPVLASKTHGAQYIINHNENGLLFDKYSIASLAQQLERITDGERRKQLAENGIECVRNHHTVDKIANKYLDSFEDIVHHDRS